MLRLISIAAVVALVAAACTTSTDAEVLGLAEELEVIAAEANAGLSELVEVLEQQFENRPELYTRITDLRLPTRFAIQLDKASRVVPPPGAEAELDRYLQYLGEILTASERLDLAIANSDPIGTAIAAVSMEASAGALAAVLPSDSCPIMAPLLAQDLCARPGLSEYERTLDFEIRRFVASFRPAFRIPDTFGDTVRAQALGSLQADASLVLQNTATRLGALEPGPAYLRLHEILLAYFPSAAEAWAEFEADPNTIDPLLFGFITSRLGSIRDQTRDALEIEYDIVLAANAESQIVEILSIWFDPPTPSTEE